MVLREKTLTRFGHDPTKLSRGSSKRVVYACDDCGVEREGSFKDISSRCRACASGRPPRQPEERPMETPVVTPVVEPPPVAVVPAIPPMPKIRISPGMYLLFNRLPYPVIFQWDMTEYRIDPLEYILFPFAVAQKALQAGVYKLYSDYHADHGVELVSPRPEGVEDPDLTPISPEELHLDDPIKSNVIDLPGEARFVQAQYNPEQPRPYRRPVGRFDYVITKGL